MTENTYKAIMTSLWLIVITSMLVWAGSGCTPEIQRVYVQPHLRLDPKPTLPVVMSYEIPTCGKPAIGPCLTKNTIQKLYDRQRLIIEDDLKCRAVVESLNPLEIKK